MTESDAHVTKSVGLSGDGDEVAAITDVERAFGVKLDYADARQWHTAGDVFASLCKVLPPVERGKTDLWERFAAALSGETGVDPKAIEPDSPLLSDSSFWAQIASASAIIWIILAVGVAVIVAAALL